MATSTKSTKAKIKTTKAKTTPKKKPAEKKSSAKVSTKSTSNKAVKTEVKKQPSKKTATMTPLQKLYAFSIAVYVALAGAAYFLMNNMSYQLSLGYWGKDDLQSVTGTKFAPATQGIVDVEIKWVVIAIAVVSLIVPVLYLTKLKSYHAEGLKQKVLPTRWFDMAVVSAIMVETAALLSGVLDIGTLKLVGGLMVVTCLLGWMAEKRTAEAGKPATAKYYLSMVTGLLPWVLIGLYAVSTYIYGQIRSPWYVYAIYGVLLFGASIIGKHQLRSLRGEGQIKYEIVEQNYAAYSLVTRTAFAVVLVIGLMAK